MNTSKLVSVALSALVLCALTAGCGTPEDDGNGNGNGSGTGGGRSGRSLSHCLPSWSAGW
jgi:hypothetical protein